MDQKVIDEIIADMTLAEAQIIMQNQSRAPKRLIEHAYNMLRDFIKNKNRVKYKKTMTGKTLPVVD